ncbi:hypothetical protein C2S52_015189 [Perilla frutescens var. hirtella]|nr:hypothetical protein C2S52_015189 [Perilla frutescens var. hirtella]
MSNYITALMFLILCCGFPAAATSSSNETDLLSLLAFKSAIDLDPQGALSSWNETVHLCSWKGIQCGTRHPDRVVEIDLRSQGLVGSLSPHLGNLSYLITILLRNNTFYGLIPQEISFLRRLTFIDFRYNSFSGSLPKNLSQLPNLCYIDLTGNSLSGNIPEDLCDMSNLQLLSLSGNTLSGSIPPSIGNLTSFKELALAFCSLEGEIPESIAQLQSLEVLLLGNNSFTGSVPSGLFNISTLQSLELDNNRLHGVIPSSIGLTLPNLNDLHLEYNQFTGSIPVSISNASLLQELVMSSNNFTGPMPRLGMLTLLQAFVVDSNLITDDISFISSLTNLTNLEYLIVGSNLLTGTLPDSIANLSSQLSTFYLDGNKIHGVIPSGIENLFNLGQFIVADNYLEGPVPRGIGKLSKLRELDLNNNRFSNKLEISFGNMTFLSNLYLNENNFSGDIPSSLANCTNLIDLDLSRNNFSGLIPPEIMRLSSISDTFNLSYNAFDGGIPYEVGYLINLVALDLSNNKLSGEIPNSLSNCISLGTLFLEGNLLGGEIPLGLSDLVVLQDLDLSLNSLSGPIPEFLGKMNLEKLNLSFNRMNGEVPNTGVFKNRRSISLEGNNGLCGGIPELKLPPCSSVVPNKKNMSTLKKILIPIVSVGGTCLALFALYINKQRLLSQKKLAPSLPLFTRIQIMRLSYLDLLNATDGFSETNLLGFGKFGSVFKGTLGNGQIVIAVKVLNLSVRGASRSFMAECNALRNVRHRNLLKILSVCESIDFQGNDFKALVYEFKSNGSLENWLHQNAESRNLNMIQRLNIATDIAQAVEYLHFGTDLSIVHGDLKPSNVLLDQDITAYVGDFGLAKIISDIVPLHETNSSTGIRGTIGYVPPEYGTSRLLSTQGDVYSYGIILLEMFTNIRPTDDLLEDHVNLHCLVNAALPDGVMEVVDSQLQALMMNNDRMKSCMTSILSIGVSCSKEMPRERMSMTDVVIQLHKIHKLLSIP